MVRSKEEKNKETTVPVKPKKSRRVVVVKRSEKHPINKTTKSKRRLVVRSKVATPKTKEGDTTPTK